MLISHLRQPGAAILGMLLALGATLFLVSTSSVQPVEAASSTTQATPRPAPMVNFGSGHANAPGIYLTNNNDFYVARRDLVPSNQTGVRLATDAMDALPGFSATYWDPTGCSDAAADVCVYDGGYTTPPYGGWYGWAECVGTISGSDPNRVCSLYRVDFNTRLTPPSYQRLACHELAHTVGLLHSVQFSTCVHTYIDNATSNNLNTHDRNHIAAAY